MVRSLAVLISIVLATCDPVEPDPGLEASIHVNTSSDLRLPGDSRGYTFRIHHPDLGVILEEEETERGGAIFGADFLWSPDTSPRFSLTLEVPGCRSRGGMNVYVGAVKVVTTTRQNTVVQELFAPVGGDTYTLTLSETRLRWTLELLGRCKSAA